MRIVRRPANNATLLYLSMFSPEERTGKKDTKTRQLLEAGQFLFIFRLQWNLDITKDQGTGKICSL